MLFISGAAASGMNHKSTTMTTMSSNPTTSNIQPNSILTQKNILLVTSSSSYFTELQASLTADGNTVSTMLATTTPTLGQLTSYDAIVVYSAYTYADPVTWGNNLADYADQGGIIIEAPYTYYTGDIFGRIDGRFLNDGYGVFTPRTNDNVAKGYSGTSSNPIMAGVSQYNTTSAMLTTVQPHAALVASYDDGTPFVAIRGNVVGFNSFPGSDPNGDGNASRIIENAINFLTPPPNAKNILLVTSSSSYLTGLQNSLTADGNTVSTMLATTTPTLGQLTSYDAIVVYSAYTYTDPVTWGDNLADYADQGGIIIEAPYTYYTGDIFGRIDGRFLNDGYGPFTPRTNDNVAMGYSGTSSNPIMAGVSQYNTTSAMLTTVQPHAALIASYDDGTPFVAVRGNVVGVNSFFGQGAAGDGNASRIIENAINFLTPPPSGKNILLVSSSTNYFTELQASLTSDGNTVSTMLTTTTPTLGQLTGYDAIVTYAAYTYTDPVTWGNNLADYADQGGIIIEAPYTYYTGDIFGRIDGRFLNDGYGPFTPRTNDNVAKGYSGTSSNPIMAGVSQYNTTSAMLTTVQPHAALIASYDGGTPFVAIRGNVVGLNSFPGTNPSGDGNASRIIENAINFVALKVDIIPVISNAADQTIELGSTGNTITWPVSDDSPNTYSVTQDGVVIDSGSYSNSQDIVVNIDGLSIGTYVFGLTIDDTQGQSATDSVTITVVDTTSPTVNSPADFTYVEGSTGNSISWSATDASPGTYSVVLDGSNYDSGAWTSGSAVVVNVDGLSVGTHTFTITFSDTQSNAVSDSVTVTVTAVPTTTTSQGTTSTTRTQQPTSSTPSQESTKTTPQNTSSGNPGLPFPSLVIICLSIVGLSIFKKKVIR